jgi:hypothetical protein
MEHSFSLADELHSIADDVAAMEAGAEASPTFVTSITLVEGGPAVHVTVYDQNGNAIPASSISWTPSSVINVAADSTGAGFNFTAVARSTATSFQITATLTTQTPQATGVLTINVVLPAVTALQFSSP